MPLAHPVRRSAVPSLPAVPAAPPAVSRYCDRGGLRARWQATVVGGPVPRPLTPQRRRPTAAAIFQQFHTTRSHIPPAVTRGRHAWGHLLHAWGHVLCKTQQKWAQLPQCASWAAICEVPDWPIGWPASRRACALQSVRSRRPLENEADVGFRLGGCLQRFVPMTKMENLRGLSCHIATTLVGAACWRIRVGRGSPNQKVLPSDHLRTTTIIRTKARI